MTRPPTASNERIVPVAVYAPDATGAALFAAVSSSIAGGINGARAVIDTSSTTWHGWTKQLQQFRGASSLGRARPYVPKSGTLSGQRSAPQSTARAIFGEQIGRQS